VTPTTFSFPTTIRFGPGAVALLPEELRRLNLQRPLLVTDAGLAQAAPFLAVQQAVGERGVVFTGVSPNPTDADVEKAARAFVAHACDAVIAVGGGSALDVGKALRLRVRRPEATLADFDYAFDWRPLAPFIAIPTTAGTGSEVGRSAVIIIGGQKRVLFHPSLLADLVILDPQLTLGLPPKLTAATGADALTHCIESFTSPVFHPLCESIALGGIRIVATSLPIAVRDGTNIEARGQTLIAAMMGGIAFQKDLGAVHSLAHPLSSVCGVHHGTANALCLPAVMKFNAARKPGLYVRVGEAMELNRPSDAAAIAAVEILLREIGIPPGLRNHGVTEAHLDALTEQAFADGCHATNPVPVTRDDLRALYEQSM
jgi:alcohol dehydrogenase class IV